MGVTLREAWELRNSAAATLIKSEDQVRQLLHAATPADVVALLEAFSPARSPGPEWTRTFDALVERLWTWCDQATLSAVHAEFQSRGQPWAAVANALAPERGDQLHAQLRSPAGARFPRFIIG